MRFAARVFFRCLSIVVLFTLLLPSFLSPAYAQTSQPFNPTDARSFAIPDAEANVPKDQHTLIQSILIEMLLATGCQLTGIDMASPTTPCLGINPTNHKLSYGIPPKNGEIQVGGLLGKLGDSIAYMYTPTITTSDYTRYLADNFGLTKKALAAPKNGFEGLAPIQGMWIATRDVSYFLLILAFIFIGLGVMLRVKIDPRTVMTVQNQVPRAIIAILLITFSYAIAAVMVDLMWTSTYVLMNVITRAANPSVKQCKNVTVPLSKTANQNLLSSPFSYANRIFVVDDCDLIENGLLDLSKGVANAISSLERDSLMTFLGLPPDGKCPAVGKSDLHWWDYVLGTVVIKDAVNIGGCMVTGPFASMMSYITSIIWMLIVFIIIIITFFRIWLELLKAYAMVILYTILAPLFIVINLLPKRPLGFERWIRVFFANLAIFPATVALILLSRIFVEAFSSKHDTVFAPPLIGSPNMNNFGVIIGFAILLLIPQLISLIREKLGVPPVKQTAAIGAAFSSGASAAGAPIGKAWKHLNRRNPQTGQPIGILAVKKGELGRKALRSIPVVGGKWAAQQEFIERTGRRATDEEMKRIDTRTTGQRKRNAPDTAAAQRAADAQAERLERANEDRIARGLPPLATLPEAPTIPAPTAPEPTTPPVAAPTLPPVTPTLPPEPSPTPPTEVHITITTPDGSSHTLIGQRGQTIKDVIRTKLASAPETERDRIMADVETHDDWKNLSMEEAETNAEVKSFMTNTPALHPHLDHGVRPPPTE